MADNCGRDDISLEYQLILRSSSMLLQNIFDATFGQEMIERFLYSSEDEFAALCEPSETPADGCCAAWADVSI